MIRSHFWKKVHTAENCGNNLYDFRAKLEPLKNGHPNAFSKIHIATVSILPIVSLPQFLMGSVHSPSTALQNKTITV